MATALSAESMRQAGKAFYNFDASSNAVALTGAGGAILNSYRYLPFGSLLTSSETVVNPFKFDGQEGVRVSGPGLHFMRARFYDAAAGRFMQMDPAGIDGGLNLYRYAENTPINDSDPSGLAPRPAFPNLKRKPPICVC